MFEQYTYDYLLESVLKNAPTGIDTRQGSIFFDAVSGPLLKIAKLYTDLDSVMEVAFLDTTFDEYLDLKASENGIERLNATTTKYSVNIDGTIPSEDEIFFIDELYFIFRASDEYGYYVEAVDCGSRYNEVYIGSKLTSVNTIDGLSSIEIISILEYGTDVEDDESLRDRVRQKIAGISENGNIEQYKTWCESIDGVERAKIFPLYNGPNTVMAILINHYGLPVSEIIVSKVQNYIDPNGSGLGEGVCSIGACFSAKRPIEKLIDVSVYLEISNDYGEEDVRAEISQKIAEYFKEITLNTSSIDKVIVRLSNIGALISNVSGVLDYYELKINDSIDNIYVDGIEVAVLGEVVIDV